LFQPTDRNLTLESLAQLRQGQVWVVRLKASPDGSRREALLVRDTDGHARAYVNRCQHLPIPLDAGTREFLTEDGAHLLCSTHGALYRIADGYCVEGPCEGESLQRLRLQIEGEIVRLLDDAPESDVKTSPG
jgi:nitrite reductase/ring-hydroxylating ferredoxin subunit